MFRPSVVHLQERSYAACCNLVCLDTSCCYEGEGRTADPHNSRQRQDGADFVSLKGVHFLIRKKHLNGSSKYVIEILLTAKLRILIILRVHKCSPSIINVPDSSLSWVGHYCPLEHAYCLWLQTGIEEVHKHMPEGTWNLYVVQQDTQYLMVNFIHNIQ